MIKTIKGGPAWRLRGSGTGSGNGSCMKKIPLLNFDVSVWNFFIQVLLPLPVPLPHTLRCTQALKMKLVAFKFWVNHRVCFTTETQTHKIYIRTKEKSIFLSPLFLCAFCASTPWCRSCLSNCILLPMGQTNFYINYLEFGYKRESLGIWNDKMYLTSFTSC